MMRNEKPGGHGDRAHAVAAVELALWDLNAKLAGVPAWKLIAEKFGVTASERMPVYAAGGYYYPEDSLGRLKDEMKGYADTGYTSFKMKIGGAPLAEDMTRIEAALSVVRDPNKLAVDANGRFDTPTAIAYGKAMAGFGLRWYEEPGDPLDYQLMSDLAVVYERPFATGENLFSLRDVDNLIRHGGMRKGHDLFQMDPALGYGLGEFARMLKAMEKAGYSRAQLFPHGGHMIALHIVVGLGLGGSEAYPGVFAPVGGYAPDCTLKDGGIAPGSLPGFGLEVEARSGAAHRRSRPLAAGVKSRQDESAHCAGHSFCYKARRRGDLSGRSWEMAEHGAVEIGTATGVDYNDHLNSYRRFLSLTKWVAIGVLVLLALMAFFLL